MSDKRPILFSPGPGRRGMTELHYAAYCGDATALARCLAVGGDPNQPDDYRGYTALHWLADMAAVAGPRVRMLTVLAKRGADLDRQSRDGDTALMLACRSGSYGGIALVRRLLALGADPRVRSAASTCLHEGLWDADLVRRLLAAGASARQRNAAGLTVLQAAQDRLKEYADEGGRGMEEVVRLLKVSARR